MYVNTMKDNTLLVLSDTHGNVKALETVLRWAEGLGSGTVGAAVFLGDGIRDLSRASEAAGFTGDWKIVRGNNDDAFSAPVHGAGFGGSHPESTVFEFGGHRLFLCHGHRHSLYGGYYSLIAAARNKEADAVLFGHTHVPCCENDEGVTLVNPGSIGRPRGRTGATFVLAECMPEKQIAVRFLGISRGGEIQEVQIPQNQFC